MIAGWYLNQSRVKKMKVAAGIGFLVHTDCPDDPLLVTISRRAFHNKVIKGMAIQQY
jgi:hypothetical protein